MIRLRAIRLLILAATVLLVYVAGLGVRRQYGIRVVVRNLTTTALRDVRINVESRGKRHMLGDIPAGNQRSIFVQPITESRIDLGFADPNGVNRVVTIVGYVEQGYCGDAAVTIYPDNRVESSSRLGCWRSWLDFM